MPKLNSLRNHSRFTRDVQVVVVSLQELSIIEMDRIRASVLSTREFTQGLLDIFLDIRISQQAKVKKELEKETPEPKTAFLFLSQNQRFSDSNITAVWQDFLAGIEQYPQAELIIVGQVGAELAQASSGIESRTKHFVSIPNHNPELNELENIFNVLRQYDRVVVFHGEFQSLIQQKSIRQDVTGRETLLNAEEFDLRQKRNFLFEPDIESLLSYFEKEVQKGVVKQALHESRLAHLGSRVQTLEFASNGIQTRLHKLEIQQHRARRQLLTKKQQQRLAGIQLWS